MAQPIFVTIRVRVRAPWLLYGPALLCALRMLSPATYMRCQQWLLLRLMRVEG